MIHQGDVISYQLVVSNLFKIDPALKEVQSLDAAKGAEVFIPYKARMHQAWLIKEIDKRINAHDTLSKN
jgi:hypothetical protein